MYLNVSGGLFVYRLGFGLHVTLFVRFKCNVKVLSDVTRWSFL